MQWDQRGAGRTYARYGNSTPDMTLDRMIEDGAEVANYARRHLHQDKVILLGHSWGSALGVYVLKRHPELFSAFVGTGMMVNVQSMLRWHYAYSWARLTADHNERGLSELRQLGPPPYSTDAQEEVMRAWLDRYLAPADGLYLLSSVGLMLRDAKYSLHDFRELQAGHLSFSLPKMHLVLENVDLAALGYDMPVPFFIIDGQEDRITPPQIAARYFQRVKAPDKAMVLIPGAGHFAMMSNSDEFLEILLHRVRAALATD